MGSKRNRLRSRHARMVQGFDAALQHAWGIIARQHLDCSRRDVELERQEREIARLRAELAAARRLQMHLAERVCLCSEVLSVAALKRGFSYAEVAAMVKAVEGVHDAAGS